MSIEIIAIISAVVVFAITISGFVLAMRIQEKKTQEKTSSEWLTSVYKVLFGKKDPTKVAKKIGLDGEEYAKNCEILHRKNDIENVIVLKLLGLFFILIGIIIGLALQLYYVLGFAIVFGFILYEYPTRSIKKKVKDRKFSIIKELPRFVDMLQVALKIGIPVEQAIDITANYLPDTVLAEEFKAASSEMNLGVSSWQDSLEKIARIYNIDDLTDFVLSLVIAYNKGVSIYDTVVAKGEDLRKSNLFSARERANRLNSSILFPVAIFKLLPLIAIMAVPMIMQLKDGF